MNEPSGVDQLTLGRRLRHYRHEAGLTLDQLGEEVGKPAPYLSLLENGKKEPRINLLMSIATALGVGLDDVLQPSPPSRRDGLEIDLLKAQSTALFDSLGIPQVKPSARMDNQTLEHLVGLHQALREKSAIAAAGSEDVRRANGAVARRLSAADGYLEAVEESAGEALEASGYAGEGPFTSRNLIDLAGHSGFEITPIEDMPPLTRSIIDLERGRIYIAQRNELRTRQARKAVLQTLGGFLLAHETEPDLDTFLMQRMETAYFAAAVLAPEERVVARLKDAHSRHDIDVEDIKELFYISYEMATWRTANILTRHFGIRTHVLVSDTLGTVVKGYSNDGVPVPRDVHGGMETQRLCRRWSARITLESPDKFDTHDQYTDTPAGTYFCTTHLEAGREPPHAITIGVQFNDARWFRGRDTPNREISTCPDPACCKVPPPELSDRWADRVIVSARAQSRILGLMAPDPYPTVDMPEVLRTVDLHSNV